MDKGIRISSLKKKELYKISKTNRGPEFILYFSMYKRIRKKVVVLAKNAQYR